MGAGATPAWSPGGGCAWWRSTGASTLSASSATLGSILIFRYLHRSLVEEIRRCLAPGGLLLYETFTVRQLELGWGPRSPRFLLEPGELPRLFASFEILEAREGLGGAERPAHLALLVARRRGAPQLCAPS